MCAETKETRLSKTLNPFVGSISSTPHRVNRNAKKNEKKNETKMKTDCKTKRKKPTTTFSFFYVVRLFFRLLPAPRRPYRPASLLYELTFSGRLASPAGRRRFCLFCLFFFGLRSSLSFVSLLSFSFCCSSG